jgi:15-cis-phytoene synthase
MTSLTQPEPLSWSVARSRAWCDRLAARSASNFYPAFRLLPRDQRQAMGTLYAFMRVTDDIVDEHSTAGAAARLANWRADLHGAIETGVDTHPVHPALRDMVRRYHVPARLLEEVIDGCEMDLEQSTYRTFDDLHGYCYRVASVVGLACVRMWGCHDPSAEEPAVAAGVALQLTNILRDVGEDAARGRVYLPVEDLERFEIQPMELSRQVPDARFKALMRFEASRAIEYYDRAAPLVPLLPRPGRAVFLMMLRTYRGLLDEIVRRDFDVFTRRVRVSATRKAWIAARSLAVRWGLIG